MERCAVWRDAGSRRGAVSHICLCRSPILNGVKLRTRVSRKKGNRVSSGRAYAATFLRKCGENIQRDEETSNERLSSWGMRQSRRAAPGLVMGVLLGTWETHNGNAVFNFRQTPEATNRDKSLIWRLDYAERHLVTHSHIYITPFKTGITKCFTNNKQKL